MVRKYIRKTDRGLHYTREQLREAVAKVRSGELNGYQAAIRYKVPRTTLYDHSSGRSGKSQTLGKPPVLSDLVENTLAENLNALQDNGFNLNKKEVLDLVGLFLKSNKLKNPFKSGKPGGYWLAGFSKRHGFTVGSLYKEFGGNEKEVIQVKEFYSLLETRIKELDLSEKPSQIWHLQEHSLWNGKSMPNDCKDTDLTFVTARSADGRKAPLLIVSKGNDKHDWMLGKHIHVSHANGMCTEVLKNYFETVFLNYIDDTGPNLVIFEGRRSLVDLDLIAEAMKAKVTMILSPTYLATLDIIINKNFELKLQKLKTLTSHEELANSVAEIFDGMQVAEIEEDFKNAGVHPFAAICDDKFDEDRLKVYEEYRTFKERQKSSAIGIEEVQEVLLKEDVDFQTTFEMELDESSASTTEDAASKSTVGGQLLRSALIAVKKGLTVMEASSEHTNDTRGNPEDAIAPELIAKKLVAWATDLTNAGFAITEDKLVKTAYNLERAPFLATTHRYEDFWQKYPELKDKLSQNLSSDTVTTESIRVWLACVKKYLKKINLRDILNCPKRIFNYGELPLYFKTNVHENNNAADDEDLTVLMTVSADGNVQVPSVIFPFKVPCGFGTSWTKEDILYDYITDIFYPWLIVHNIQFPVILFMDRETHINNSLYEYINYKQIIPIALLSTEIQPIQAVFRLLIRYWENNISDMQTLNNEERAKEVEIFINRRDFRAKIKNSFKSCGISPFDRNIKYIANEIEKTNETNETKSSRIREPEKELNVTNEKNHDILKEVQARISKEILEKFMESGDSWKGDPLHESLFVFWKGLRDECSKGDTLSEAERNVTLDEDFFEIIIENEAEQFRNF